MELNKAETLFAIRLYDWALQDFVRELEEGCPLLCTMGLNNRRIAAFVTWNETLSLKERHKLARALIRRTHEKAARLKGEVITAEDNKWHDVFYQQTTLRMQQLPPLMTADTSDPVFCPVDPDECLDFLFTVLSPNLGKSSRRKSQILCKRWLGDWSILTEFTFNRRHEDLRFEYQFIRKDGKPVKTGHPAQGPFPRTLLYFYGLYDSVVSVPSRADSEPMAKTMAQLAEHFMLQAAPVFAGLGIED